MSVFFELKSCCFEKDFNTLEKNKNSFMTWMAWFSTLKSMVNYDEMRSMYNYVLN